MDKKGKRGLLIAGIATITGTMIGAGILGMPYAISKSGFLVGLIFIVLLGLVALNMNLFLGEVSLRTKGNHQLPGYAEKYLGKTGKIIMVFSMLFGIYAALTAYLIAEGQSLSYLFFGNFNSSFYFALFFFVIALVLVSFGLNTVKKEISVGVFILILLVVIIALTFIPKINIGNLSYSSDKFTDLIFPYGVVFFAMLAYSALPELEQELKGNEKLMKKSIIIGTLIPLIVYIIFTIIIVGFAGKNTPEIATFSIGKIAVLLGIIGISNAFMILSTAIKDMYHLDLKLNKFVSLCLALFIPLLLFLFIHFFDLGSFITFLSWSGAVSGGLTGILALFMLKNAKKHGNRKPEYSMPLSWPIIVLLILLFVFGILTEFLL